MSALPRECVVGDNAHLYPVRVYWEDTDAAGFVYYANYLKFAERARSEMLRRLGIEQERMRAETGLVFVVRRASVDYLLPARLDDDLVVSTRLAGLRGASLDLDQEVRREAQTLARLAFQIAAVGRGGRPQRLPSALRAALSELNESTRGMVRAHAR